MTPATPLRCRKTAGLLLHCGHCHRGRPLGSVQRNVPSHPAHCRAGMCVCVRVCACSHTLLITSGGQRLILIESPKQSQSRSWQALELSLPMARVPQTSVKLRVVGSGVSSSATCLCPWALVFKQNQTHKGAELRAQGTRVRPNPTIPERRTAPGPLGLIPCTTPPRSPRLCVHVCVHVCARAGTCVL